MLQWNFAIKIETNQILKKKEKNRKICHKISEQSLSTHKTENRTSEE